MINGRVLDNDTDKGPSFGGRSSDLALQGNRKDVHGCTGADRLSLLLKFTLTVFYSRSSPLFSAVSAKCVFRKWLIGRRGRLTALPEANDFIVEHQAGGAVRAQTSVPPRRADSSHSTGAKRFLEPRPLLPTLLPSSSLPSPGKNHQYPAAGS